jgi:hypothetical protein
MTIKRGGTMTLEASVPMKRIAVGLLFALLVVVSMVGHAAFTHQAEHSETLAVNWNSRVKK